MAVDFFNNEKTTKKRQNKIASSIISKYSINKVKEIVRDFRFDLEKLAHGGILFCAEEKSPRNEKKLPHSTRKF